MIPAQNIVSLIDETREIMRKCTLCSRKCGVNRLEGETGFCGLGSESFLFKHFIHHGEEGGLSPSYTVYFTGCSFRCGYCSNRNSVVNPDLGEPLDSRKLAQQIDSCSSDVRNINFLGGEPTVNLLGILEILSFMKTDIPVVWNSNMYASEQTMKIIDAVTDIYLADFKFGSNSCAEQIAGCENYVETVMRNLQMPAADKRIIIRHLPLPGHAECCSFPVIEMLAENLPGVEISIISALVPNREFPAACDAGTLKKIAEFAEESGLHVLEQPSPVSISTEQTIGGEIVETTIVLRPDGSVIFQDYSTGIANLAERIVSAPDEEKTR